MSGPVGLAYCDRKGRIYYDASATPLADAGIVREPSSEELIPAPDGIVQMILPGRHPLFAGKKNAVRQYPLAIALPAGYTRLLLPAYDEEPAAPPLPLFGYTFACVIDDDLMVAAMKTDESEDWQPRRFGAGELEELIAGRLASDRENRVLRQVALCSREYGCFTAQNVFLQLGEAALPVSPKCNARCVGCISQLDAEEGFPSPQARIRDEMDANDLARVAIAHLERVPDGIVSFGQGCEGEPLLRSIAIARAIEAVRSVRSNGTINLNTNGSLPSALDRCVDAGLQAVRVSLNSFRPRTYSAYYRPVGYELEDVLESVRRASRRGVRVSLNLLTHPGVTDEVEELRAMEGFLREVPVDMVQTRTLNIDPHRYFSMVGRPRNPLGMRHALEAIRALAKVGNFTHTH